MPGASPSAVARERSEIQARDEAGGPAGILPRRLHPAASTLRTDAPEQTRALRTAVPLGRRHAAGGGGEPQAPGRRDRLLVRAAHLGTDADPPSAYPLRPAGGRLLPRPHPLGDR